MFSREQKRTSVLGDTVGPADVDVRPDVFLLGQDADAAGDDRVF